MTQTTSVLVEIPSDLHDQLAQFLEHHPGCTQDIAYASGLALLLTTCPETATVAQQYLDQLVQEAIAS